MLYLSKKHLFYYKNHKLHISKKGRLLSILGISFSLFFCHNVQAMEGPENRPQEVIFQKTQQKRVRQVTAQERFNFLKEQYKDNPTFTMVSPIGEKLWAMYNRDKAFLLKSTQNRKDYTYIKEKVTSLDQAFQEKGWHQSFSLMDYHFIGYVWSIILSKPRNDHLPDLMKRYQWKKENDWNSIDRVIIKENLDYTESLYEFPLPLPIPNNCGLTMPHVSFTGSIPIKIINEGWAFEINGAHHFIHFLSVGTNEYLDFDANRKKPCFASWVHDWAAHGSDLYLFNDTSAAQLALKPIISLRNCIDKLPDDQKRLAELSFFDVFHEGGIRTQFYNLIISNPNIGSSLLKTKIYHLYKDRLNKYMTFTNQHISFVEKGGNFNTRFAETNVLAVKSLQLPHSKGMSLKDQYLDYNRQYLEGLEILQKLFDITSNGSET